MTLIINRSVGYEYRWHLPSILELRDIHHLDIGNGLHEIPFAIILPVYVLIASRYLEVSLNTRQTFFILNIFFIITIIFKIR